MGDRADAAIRLEQRSRLDVAGGSARIHPEECPETRAATQEEKKQKLEREHFLGPPTLFIDLKRPRCIPIDQIEERQNVRLPKPPGNDGEGQTGRARRGLADGRIRHAPTRVLRILLAMAEIVN